MMTFRHASFISFSRFRRHFISPLYADDGFFAAMISCRHYYAFAAADAADDY